MRLRYIKEYRDCTGKVRRYFRKGSSLVAYLETIKNESGSSDRLDNFSMSKTQSHFRQSEKNLNDIKGKNQGW